MALQEVVNQQGDLVLASGDQVVIGEADPIVVRSPVWGGQSPGTVWHEYSLSSFADTDGEGVLA